MHIDEITFAVTETLASLLEVDSGLLDVERSFHEMGVDSVLIVGLSAEFEDRFGISLDPELAYLHDTVSKVSQHLYGVINQGALGAVGEVSHG
ncbi:phosphopantetheine-binding protein [Pseudomonas chlororaphis]|uniref:acyl carrier protein n=1 Tax=Pseudomonas chlororaphis TaxID=587753 RepID=UPI000789F4D6|nr:acyl carrier protein [Pseudomonas chlororaphis]AMS16228.1 phosphopantetheine-binding protein [Pseudomonas chlororaphis]